MNQLKVFLYIYKYMVLRVTTFVELLFYLMFTEEHLTVDILLLLKLP